MAPPEDDISAARFGEIGFQSVPGHRGGGAALASVLTLNPLPFLLWLGSEMVLLPILDSARCAAGWRDGAARWRARSRNAARQPHRRVRDGPMPSATVAAMEDCAG